MFHLENVNEKLFRLLAIVHDQTENLPTRCFRILVLRISTASLGKRKHLLGSQSKQFRCFDLYTHQIISIARF